MRDRQGDDLPAQAAAAMSSPATGAPAGGGRLLRERFGPVLKLTLNRPEALNALDVDLFRELTLALVDADADAQVQIVVVTGAGRGFCTGADLKAVVEHHADDRQRVQGAYDYAAAADGLFRQIREMGKIVVAMVNGPAYGGGLVLAASSDISVVSDRATFRVPEALAGIADELSTVWLTASVGVARAKHLILTAKVFDAAEAERLGLVSVVVGHDRLWERTLDACDEVLATGPVARSVFKRIINDRLPVPSMRTIVEAHLSAESHEGCAAFAAKRSPAWQRKAERG